MISVVIPVRNDGAALRRLLAELQALRSAHFEIIVIEAEDSSIESSLRHQADQWQRAPAGRARQLQQGVATAQGQCLWFLHADSTQIAGAARWLKAHAQRTLRQPFGAGWGRFDVRFDDSSWSMAMVAWFMNWRSRLTGICTGDQGIFVDRSLLAEVGGWPQQPLMEDVELSSRLRRQTPLHVPSGSSVCLTTSARRWRANGTLRTIVLMWRLRLSYRLGKDPAELYALYYPRSAVPSHSPVQERQRESG